MHSPAEIHQRHAEIFAALKFGDQQKVQQNLMNHYVDTGQSIAQYAKIYYGERKIG